MNIVDEIIEKNVQLLPEHPTGWVVVKETTKGDQMFREIDNPDYPFGGVIAMSYAADPDDEESEEEGVYVVPKEGEEGLSFSKRTVCFPIYQRYKP